MNNSKFSFAGLRKELHNTYKRYLSFILPYRSLPGGKPLLDTEYAGGTWDYLRSVSELSRFSVVAGYCHYFKPGGQILEIGCGEGILQERLSPDKYSQYMGVDISVEAIKRAFHKQNESICFVAEDAEIFEPRDRFDIIIFNESLEYFTEPLALVRKYEHFIKDNGLFIVSMFVGSDTFRTKRIWKMLESVYAVEAETRVTDRSGFTWNIKVFFPLVKKNAEKDLRTFRG